MTLAELAERTRRLINTPGERGRRPNGYQVSVIEAVLREAVREERKRILAELGDNPIIASLLDARDAETGEGA